MNQKVERIDKYKSHLVWIDCEMTGLHPERDTILEIACIVTDNNLEIIEKGPNLIINHSDIILDGMDEWNTEHHTNSGLVAQVRHSDLSMHDAQAILLEFIQKHCKKREAPLCGNSVWQDRLFLAKYMKEIDQYLNYRIIDVSSIKEVIRRWYPNNEQNRFFKQERHRAEYDIEQSIEELKHYREYFFVNY